MAGVKWYAEGVFHRETVLGKEMSAKYVTPLVPGALIYNRLFAWKESFAVVGPEHAGLCVSSEFPQFLPDTARLMPKFIYLFCTRPTTIEMVNAASAGSAAVSRNRFKEEEFLKLEMPLPPLAEQRAIVERWFSAQAQIAAASVRVEDLEQQTEAKFASALGISATGKSSEKKCFALHWHELERWAVSFATNTGRASVALANVRYGLVPLGSIALVTYGIQKCPENRPGKLARPYLRVANVQRGELDLQEIKTIEVSDIEFKNLKLQKGDLLVCEGNSADLVGRPAIWNDEIQDCVHQNHLLRVRVDSSKVEAAYLLHYMSTPSARAYFRSRAKFTTNLASINSRDLRELPIPIPPLEVQRKLVERVTAARMEIARERAATAELRQTIAAEVESLILGNQPRKPA